MERSELGVSIAIEAHRRELLTTELLSAVLAYYEGMGSKPAPTPAEVLGRHGVPEARVLSIIEELVPSETKRFSSRLTLHRELGRGAMGVVHQGYDRVLKRVVAIKSLKFAAVSGERGRLLLQRFEREAQVMARLRHPAIAQLHDAGVDEQGLPYLVMEFVSGRTLENVIEMEKPLDPRRVLRWGATLAQALHACHRAGVVHRDVKPSNVMITAEDEVRLVDFGVAFDEQAVERLTATNTTVGTLLYMAPEQALHGRCDALSDIYSLAATLYHALVGRPPLEADHPVLMIELLLKRPVDPVHDWRADVPARASDVLLRCLAKAPGDRPAHAEALANELHQALELPAIGTQRMRRALVGSSLVLVAFMVLLSLVGRSGSRPDPGPTNVGTPAEVAGQDSTTTPSTDTTRARSTSTAAPGPLPAGIIEGRLPGEYINVKDGSLLVFVPAGQFTMGHAEEQGQAREIEFSPRWNDRPAHRVLLPGYFIGKYEVTWAQYERFLAETPSFAPSGSRTLTVDGRVHRAEDNHPVFRVSWKAAEAYCRWAQVRLPTEAEWEHAARGAREGLYPWGASSPSTRHANLFGAQDGQSVTCPGGSFPLDTSEFGCVDMAGNVSEWVADLFGPYVDGPASEPRGCEQSTQTWAGLQGWRDLVPGEGPLRVIRGGAWATSDGRPPDEDFRRPGAYTYQLTRRYAGHETAMVSAIVGFRVCR